MFWRKTFAGMIVFCTLLSTKNIDLTKCRLVDFIKGSKSMVFFVKYLIINSIVISNPFGRKIDANNWFLVIYSKFCQILVDANVFCNKILFEETAR